MKMIKAGVIGLGYWGPSLRRNFYENSEIEVVMAADPRAGLQGQYPTVRYVEDGAEVINASGCAGGRHRHTCASALPTPKADGKKILIIDDEPMIAKGLRIRLQALGYRAYEAMTGMGIQRDVLTLGAERWINKPFEIKDLMKIIKERIGPPRKDKA